MIRLYSGGAHCCVTSWIASGRQESEWELIQGETLDGGGYWYEDIDGDGSAELISADNSFLYTFEGYAGSWPPMRIARLTASGLSDVSDLSEFKRRFRQDIAGDEFLAKLNPSLWRSNGFLAGWVASKSRVGELVEAWEKMLPLYDRFSIFGKSVCADGTDTNCEYDERIQLAFPAGLALHLEQNGYGPLPAAIANNIPLWARSTDHASPEVDGGWIIQIAAMQTESAARAKLDFVRSLFLSVLSSASPYTEKITKDGVTIYRAGFSGFSSELEAKEICNELHKNKFACLTRWIDALPAAPLVIPDRRIFSAGNGGITVEVSTRVIDDEKIDFVRVEGPFKTGDEKIFKQSVLTLKNPALVSFQSPGGDLHSGMEIGRAIWTNQLMTVVEDGVCASAYALAWLAGRPRFAGPDARIGFHAPTLVDDPDRQPDSVGSAWVGGYLTELGFTSAAIAYMTEAGPDEMNWLNPDEARGLGIYIEDIALPSGPDELPPTKNDESGAKAVLYEGPLDAMSREAGVGATQGDVWWHFIEDGPSGPEIAATVNVPSRGLRLSLAIRRNTDPALQASHVVEMEFNEGVRSAPRLVFKTTEHKALFARMDDIEDSLIGEPSRPTGGVFRIALSAAKEDVDRNLRLLRRPWIDLPLVYKTGARAILTLEKGPAGNLAVDQGLTAWADANSAGAVECEYDMASSVGGAGVATAGQRLAAARQALEVAEAEVAESEAAKRTADDDADRAIAHATNRLQAAEGSAAFVTEDEVATLRADVVRAISRSDETSRALAEARAVLAAAEELAATLERNCAKLEDN